MREESARELLAADGKGLQVVLGHRPEVRWIVGHFVRADEIGDWRRKSSVRRSKVGVDEPTNAAIGGRFMKACPSCVLRPLVQNRERSLHS